MAIQIDGSEGTMRELRFTQNAELHLITLSTFGLQRLLKKAVRNPAV